MLNHTVSHRLTVRFILICLLSSHSIPASSIVQNTMESTGQLYSAYLVQSDTDTDINGLYTFNRIQCHNESSITYTHTMAEKKYSLVILSLSNKSVIWQIKRQSDVTVLGTSNTFNPVHLRDSTVIVKGLENYELGTSTQHALSLLSQSNVEIQRLHGSIMRLEQNHSALLAQYDALREQNTQCTCDWYGLIDNTSLYALLGFIVLSIVVVITWHLSNLFNPRTNKHRDHSIDITIDEPEQTTKPTEFGIAKEVSVAKNSLQCTTKLTIDEPEQTTKPTEFGIAKEVSVAKNSLQCTTKLT
eukprot:622134_1